MWLILASIRHIKHGQDVVHVKKLADEDSEGDEKENGATPKQKHTHHLEGWLMKN